MAFLAKPFTLFQGDWSRARSRRSSSATCRRHDVGDASPPTAVRCPLRRRRGAPRRGGGDGRGRLQLRGGGRPLGLHMRRGRLSRRGRGVWHGTHDHAPKETTTASLATAADWELEGCVGESFLSLNAVLMSRYMGTWGHATSATSRSTPCSLGVGASDKGLSAYRVDSENHHGNPCRGGNHDLVLPSAVFVGVSPIGTRGFMSPTILSPQRNGSSRCAAIGTCCG